MDYTQGYRAIFYATEFDPVTWTDFSADLTRRIDLISGSISRTNTDLRQSASLVTKDYNIGFEQWIRIYMVAEQMGEQKREALFTGIATSPSDSHQGVVVNSNIQCYSVLKPAADIYLSRGWYANKNMNAITIIKELLKPINPTNANVVITPNNAEAYLQDYVIAEDQETNLTMIEKILDAIGWMMQIQGDGTIVLSPYTLLGQDEPVLTMSPYENDIVETSFNIEHDWFECPNCIRVTYNGAIAIYKDEDPDSPLSVQNRGREVWAVEDSPALSTGESLYEYAKLRLHELQEMNEVATYTRRFMPEVNVDDIVRLGYSDLSGDFIVETQNINLGYAANVSETVKRGV